MLFLSIAPRRSLLNNLLLMLTHSDLLMTTIKITNLEQSQPMVMKTFSLIIIQQLVQSKVVMLRLHKAKSVE